MWIKFETCEQVVSELWDCSDGANPNSALMRNLEHCKIAEEVKWKQRGKAAWLAEDELYEVIRTLLARVIDEMNQKLLEEYTADEGAIRGVAIARNALRISHLLFADDTLIFCDATTEAMRSIRDVLRVYGKASGQMINLDKSLVVFSRNTPLNMRETLANILGVQVETQPTKYLGLPYLIGRNEKNFLQ
ncbi:hypothetical protein Sango_0377300 [Sesamum angolense]|uniref:Reverse transcriptase domain-containing protein n=1 Tax=Sesamum angolense TaxID=2727404 RepID=A0AAE1X9Z9_9LAMI|nr:hypothetical protein Sango_0377300 [Sesamum angolense]